MFDPHKKFGQYKLNTSNVPYVKLLRHAMSCHVMMAVINYLAVPDFTSPSFAWKGIKYKE